MVVSSADEVEEDTRLYRWLLLAMSLVMDVVHGPLSMAQLGGRRSSVVGLTQFHVMSLMGGHGRCLARYAGADLDAADVDKARSSLAQQRMEDDQRPILRTVFASPSYLFHLLTVSDTRGLKRLGTTGVRNRRAYVSRLAPSFHGTCQRT